MASYKRSRAAFKSVPPLIQTFKEMQPFSPNMPCRRRKIKFSLSLVMINKMWGQKQVLETIGTFLGGERVIPNGFDVTGQFRLKEVENYEQK